MEGTLLFITTNNPEHLDPAIGGGADLQVSRPGRVDRILEFKSLDAEGAQRVADRILSGLDVDPQRYASLLRRGIGVSPAIFQEWCFQLALATRFDDGWVPTRSPSRQPEQLLS